MQVVANGHVQRSAVEWSGIIARYRQSGLGMKAFCEQEGLRWGRVEEWYRGVRRSETGARAVCGGGIAQRRAAAGTKMRRCGLPQTYAGSWRTVNRGSP